VSPATILLDVSESMNTPVMGGQRRVDLLSTILKNVMMPGVRLVAFSDSVIALEPDNSYPSQADRLHYTWHLITCRGCPRGT
jgi:hypothetical protein